MTRFLKKLFLFGLLFILLNILYLGILILTDWNFSKRIEAISLNEPSYEFVVLGNSLAMDAIDCEVLESKENGAYNLSIGGSSIRTNYIQLEEYLKLCKEKPETVILGLGSYLNDFNRGDINPIVAYTMEDRNYSYDDLLPMFKFRWLCIELIKKVISKDHRNFELIQGQLRIDRVVADKSKLPDPLPDLEIARFNNSKYLEKIAQMCDQNQIKLVVLELPGFKKTRNKSSIGPYVLFNNKYPNSLLFNFNNFKSASALDPKKDWLGNSHLNVNGAKKFTTQIVPYLDSQL